MAAEKKMTISELLKGLPTNFGRWGANDEIGALNFLTAKKLKGDCRPLSNTHPSLFQL